MSLSIIGMYAATSGGTEDALASIDIPSDGRITGVDWAVSALLNADGELLEAELSFLSTNQIRTNDARGSISQVRLEMYLLTSGATQHSANKFVALSPGLEVAAGERLYIHSRATAGVVASLGLALHLDLAKTVRARMRRR
jgi:hypothetical protein